MHFLGLATVTSKTMYEIRYLPLAIYWPRCQEIWITLDGMIAISK